MVKCAEKVKIRVNRFNVKDIDDKKFDTLYVYTVKLPQIRGRDAKNANVKRLFMGQVLSGPNSHPAQTQPWTSSYDNNKISTDWINTIVTKTPLEQLSNPAPPKNDNGQVLAPVNLPNDGLGVATVNAEINLDHQLDIGLFRDFVNGTGEPVQRANFNFSLYTRAFNVLVRHFASRDPATFAAGRSRLFPRLPINRLPSCLEARTGLFNSFRPAIRSWQLQVNSSAAAFLPSVGVVTFLQDRFRADGFNNNGPNTNLMPMIGPVLRSRQVGLLYQPSPDNAVRSPLLPVPTTPAQAASRKLKTITGFGASAFQQTFDVAGGRRSVQKHFENYVMQPGFRLQYPNLPVINTGGQNNGQEVWIPMELLFITEGQALSTTVPENDMRTMAPYSRRTPAENVHLIEGTNPGDGMHLIKAADLRTSGILNLDLRMLDISGRMLPAPTLEYGNRKIVRNNATGKWNLMGQTFRQPSDIGILRIIRIGNTQLSDQDAQRFVTDLEKYGVKCSRGAEQVAVNSASPNDLHGALSYFRTNSRAKHIPPLVILVIPPSNSIDNYAQVKSWGDCQVGFQTVCLTKVNAEKKLPSDAGLRANLALKFNTKLGKVNHLLNSEAYKLLHSTSNSGTMVVGADVTHPGPNSIAYCPSIAAVVASTDKQCMKFPGSMRLQQGRTENIIDLQAMMTERLRLWYDGNKNLPSRILFYRDGVGEDQFAEVKRKELAAIKDACRAIGQKENCPDYMPQITLVICTKRHAVRFYPNAKDMQAPRTKYTDNRGNFLPGLVVDDEAIRLPKFFDFWLQGHAPLQGTGRPCHYFVIENGIGFTPADLQQVTFALSWIYATSLTPISTVGPAYYADKLCERGRCYLRPLLVGQHAQRPTATQHRAFLDTFIQTYQNNNPGQNGQAVAVPEEAIRQHVVNEVSAGQYPVATGVNGNPGPPLWRHTISASPCNVRLEKNMFYV